MKIEPNSNRDKSEKMDKYKFVKAYIQAMMDDTVTLNQKKIFHQLSKNDIDFDTFVQGVILMEATTEDSEYSIQLSKMRVRSKLFENTIKNGHHSLQHE